MSKLSEALERHRTQVELTESKVLDHSDEYYWALGDPDPQEIEDARATIVCGDVRISVRRVKLTRRWTTLFLAEASEKDTTRHHGGSLEFTLIDDELHKATVDRLKNEDYEVEIWNGS